MLAVNEYENILCLQTILFQQRGCFQNAAASGDKIVDDEDAIASGKAALDAALACTFRADTCIDQRSVGLYRIGCSQQQTSYRHTCYQGKRMDSRTT